MARLKDWFGLADSTMRDLRTKDMTNLYSLEWPEAKRVLIDDYAATIERERGRIKRTILTFSAMMHGLAKRLAPQRRLVFVVAEIAAVVSLLTYCWSDGSSRDEFWIMQGLIVPVVLLTFVLGMEIIDKLKYRDELELARDLQSNLIPKDIRQTKEIEVAAHNQIANTVGGDIYDFIDLPDGRFAVLFGDASGHGMAAGLVMAVAHAAFRTQLDVDPEPDAMFATLNRILCRTGGSRKFFAAVYLLIEPDGQFRAKIAGHPPMLHLDANGNVLNSIGLGAYPLGVKANLEWPTHAGRLLPGNLLVLNSDGLVEARNGMQGEFGDDRLLNILRCYSGRSPLEIVTSLRRELDEFTDMRPPDDDVSIAVLRFQPEPAVEVSRDELS